ncbi:CopG family DNA-binding protein [Gluconacetobacter johannae DSM 13595]|uniref:Type II toxin-antitoxin system HicB family antitoxin n=1 Tax=Gluconacetobacter johannae TaxID=112140 RepID=A0A7W4J8C9_9PROT|nr:type II toxin-antitoxin system HicB family antitoxin [Gluconacetobacter johannae]MBB2176327.1 type II toxin-antitoxin system HicB family antitoxin [Gluconacetobacter johannae]GBQ90408.1 CopG family DNA-binding protein [Gluconacetobacter johannae DSM 13595]
MRYPIVIEHGSDAEAYGVVVPDLPGCFSAGDTFDEAVSNASEAIALWIEDAIDHGQSVPRPSSLDALRANSQWSGPEWIWGFASVDPAFFDDMSERVNITLPRRVLARLDSRAKEAGETRSGFIAKLALGA